MRGLSSIALLPPLALVSQSIAQSESRDAPTVTVDSGPLRGLTTQVPGSDVTVNEYLGVPFAQPPTGDLRFAPPREPEPWTEPLDVSEQPSACIQFLGVDGPSTNLSNTIFNDPPVPSEDEDCLYLNVFVPEGGEANKSVLFWIHGGSGIMGGISLPLYDGTDFAANQDVIVVMANYRLSIFGGPNAPQLDVDESSLALLDQRLALDWTRRNIAAFGGDPEKVTVMGESAGAMAVGHFINTFPTDPPFRAGIEMSGSSVAAAGSAPDVQHIQSLWPQLMALINCTNTDDPAAELSCARAISARELMTVLEVNDLRIAGGVPDNITSLARPDIAWSQRDVAHVPLLIGSTAQDVSFWVISIIETLQAAAAANGTEFTPPSLSSILESSFDTSPEIAAIIQEIYAPGSPYYSGPNDTVSIVTQIGTDYTFRCTSNFVANLTSTLLQQPVWQYEFNATTPSTTFESWPDLGAYHASEIAFVFGTYNRTGSAGEADVELGRLVQKRFADFVKNPSGDGGPGWAQWPAVGVIGMTEGQQAAKVEEVSGRELAPVCQLFDALYLQELPALANFAAVGGGNTTEGAGDASAAGGSGGGSGGDATGLAATTVQSSNAAIVLGVLALGAAAVL